MNTRTEHLIEAWFANTLSEPEKAELRQILVSDPEAATEFAWQQSLAHAVSNVSLGTGPLKSQLQELENRFRFRRIIFQVAAIAAVVLALFVAIKLLDKPGALPSQGPIAATEDTLSNPGFIPKVTPPDTAAAAPASPQEALKQDEKQAAEALQRQQEAQRKKRLLRDSLQQVVVANFPHFRNISKYNTAGGVDEKELKTMQAFALYDAKKYKEAAQAFQPLVEADASNMEIRFYYGVSLLGDQQFEAASKTLPRVTEVQGKYQTPATFYLGMALTGAEQYKEARKSFDAYLAAPNNRQFKALAETMLQKLPPH